MSGSRPFKVATGPNVADERTFGRANAQPLVEAGIGSAGHQIEPGPRAELEARFGQDFSHVRVHADARAADAAEALRANAYTSGRDVVFGEGRYTPGTSDGKRLLAHELAHVVQQGRGPGLVTDCASAETEARQASVRAVSGQSVAIQSAGAGGVQFDAKDDDDPVLRAFAREKAKRDSPATGSPEWIRQFQGKPETASLPSGAVPPAGPGAVPPTTTGPPDSRAHAAPPKPANPIDAFRAQTITRADAQRLYDDAPIAVPEAVSERVQALPTDELFRERDRLKRQLSVEPEGTPGRAELRTQERAMDREAQQRRTAYEQLLASKLPEMAKAMDDELGKEDRGLRTFKPHDFVDRLTSEAYGEQEYRIFSHGVRRYVRGGVFVTVEEHHWLIGLGTVNFVTGEVKPESYVEFRGGAESEGLGPLEYIIDLAGALGILRGLGRLALRGIARAAGRLSTTAAERALGKRIATKLGGVPGAPAEAPRLGPARAPATRGPAGPVERPVPPAVAAPKGSPASGPSVPKAEVPGGASSAPRPVEAPRPDAAMVVTPPKTPTVAKAAEPAPPSAAATKVPAVAKPTEAAPPAPAAPKPQAAVKPAEASPSGPEPSARSASPKDSAAPKTEPRPDKASAATASAKTGAPAEKPPSSTSTTAKPAEAAETGAAKPQTATEAPSPASQATVDAGKAKRVADLQQKRVALDNRVKELEAKRDLHEQRRTKYQDEATKRQNAGKPKEHPDVANKQRQATNEANHRIQKDSEIAALKTEKAQLKSEIDDINRPRAETPQQEGRDAESRITRDSGMPKHGGKHQTSFPGTGSPTGLRNPDFMPKPDGKGGWTNAKDPSEAEWIADSKVLPEAGKIRLSAQVKGFIELASKIKLTPSRTRKVLMLITDQEIAPEVIQFGKKYGVQVFRASQPPW
jgi:hypothetical protein